MPGVTSQGGYALNREQEQFCTFKNNQEGTLGTKYILIVSV